MVASSPWKLRSAFHTSLWLSICVLPSNTLAWPSYKSVGPNHRFHQYAHRNRASLHQIRVHVSPAIHSNNDIFSASFSNITDAMAECWRATSWSVNPLDQDDVNEVIRCFNSPAPQAYHAFQRALRLSDDPEQVLQVFSYLLKKGHRFEMETAALENEEESIEHGKGHRNWRIVAPTSIVHSVNNEANASHHNDKNKPKQTTSKTPWIQIHIDREFPNTLSIAHTLLDLAIDTSESWYDGISFVQQENDNWREKRYLEDLCLHRLQLTLGLDIRGRSAADAAFSLAIAGVTRPDLFELLTKISYLELKRTGSRPSFPSKYILQIVEKLAAAGVGGPGQVISDTTIQMFQLATDLLRGKSDSGHHTEVIKALEDAIENYSNREHSSASSFGLHSTWPLLWLWRFAARQTKARTFVDARDNFGDNMDDDIMELSNTKNGVCLNNANNWIQNYEDLSRPLVVDIGCGMGVSLLGLATLSYGSYEDVGRYVTDFPSFGESCNYLGGDLSLLSLNYARGIADRWNIQNRVQFAHQSAVGLLEDIISSRYYLEGTVPLIMIQFPTPYKLHWKEAGNHQLPNDEESGFMVTLEVLRLARDILQQSNGYLLLQSNCEDVAVKMRRMAVDEVGFRCVEVEPKVTELPSLDCDLPLRTRQWIQMGGERPIGEGWLAEPFLPRKGFTETEVNCGIQGTPVHRCLLQCGIVSSDDNHG
ncbi:putative methyltransferase [Nitzschia inconspicua]|uniref:Methyltransferase n=1 Tax=Nitzschia inconspicua TaxID=303405 RepID=A0A9K3L7J1_9STRA|nr:putative methyltransferase [Nitzschia inconspicua]